MKEKMYVKDILSLFEITRDALKYYEKQGLITGQRDVNGYRYYDYLDVKRIERVLWLLKTGFSVDQVKHYLRGLPFEEEMRMNAVRIQELEEEIRLLQDKLRFVRHMDAYQRMIPEYYRQYAVCHNINICAGCEQGQMNRLGALSHREMKVLHLREDFSVERVSYHDKILAAELMLYNEECRDCTCTVIANGSFVQGIIKLKDLEEFPKRLPDIQQDMDQQGYILGHEIYCFFLYYIEADPAEEGVAVNFFIPIQKKEE